MSVAEGAAPARLMRRIVLGIAIAAVAIGAYLPGLPGAFVYDDHRLIADNEGLRRPFDLSRSFLRDYYASDVDRMGLGYYRPMALLSNELDYRRGGGRPAAFHATNIALHVACSLLVFGLGIVLYGGGRAELGAAAAGALFALHPAHAESVAFISGRVDPLATLFGAAALLVFVSAGARPGWARAGLAAALFFLALLSKEMAITVPVICLLLVAAIERQGEVATSRRDWGRFVPFGLVIAPYLALRWTALGRWTAAAEGVSFSWHRPFEVLGCYLAWLVWPPSGLHLEPPPPNGIFAVLAAALCVVVLVAWSVLRRRGAWLEAALLAACLASLLPVAQLKPLETTLSERFLYGPSVYAALLAGAVLASAKPRGAVVAALAIVAVAGRGAVVTAHRSALWRDEVALWNAHASEQPSSMKAWLNLGRAHAARGEVEAARAAYAAARRLAPDPAQIDAEEQSLLASSDSAAREGAIRHALAQTPNDASLWNNLGVVLLDAGRVDEAREALQRAVVLAPARSSAWTALALASMRAGRFDEAEPSARRASAIDPAAPLPRALIGECLLRTGHPCEASRAFEGIRLDDAPTQERVEQLRARAEAACREVERPSAAR